MYNAVKKITSLSTEGITEEEVEQLYKNELKKGDTGNEVRVVQYILQTIAFFDSDIPFLEVTPGVFGDNTTEMLEAFQKKYALPVTGIANRPTWARLRTIYNETLLNLDPKYSNNLDEYFPGRFLLLGMTGDDVRLLQEYLYIICTKYGDIPGVRVNGVYDDLTRSSVEVLQQRYNLPVNGVVGPVTWDEIVILAKAE